MADAKIEDFNFKNEESHVDEVNSFQIFVDSSTDSESPTIKFLKAEVLVQTSTIMNEYIQRENKGPINIP